MNGLTVEMGENINFGRPPAGAKIFFRDSVKGAFNGTLQCTSGEEMKEIGDLQQCFRCHPTNSKL
jgi:hypothetical protein